MDSKIWTSKMGQKLINKELKNVRFWAIKPNKTWPKTYMKHKLLETK